MNTLPHRLALGLVFVSSGKVFDHFADDLPYAPIFWLLYYGGAATVDLLLFHVTGLFVHGRLRFHVEALCTALAATNAAGYALLVLADAPPDLYNLVIKGLNYVLATRLLMGDCNAMDLIRSINEHYSNGLVRRDRFKFSSRLAQKETR